MKLLFLVDSLWVGGTERSLIEMVPGLRAAGIESTIVCCRGRHEGVTAEAARHGIEPLVLRPGTLIQQARQLRDVLRKRRPDLVHTSLFRSNLVGRLAAAGWPGKVVGSLVNTPYAPVRRADASLSRLRLGVVRLVDALTSRFLVDHFHAVSLAAKEAAIRDLWLPPDRITVVRRGRDPARLGDLSPARRQQARLQLGLSEEDLVIVNVGRQDFQKGQDQLLLAAAKLSRPEVKVLIVGREGSASEHLRRLAAELELGARVRFLGHRDDVPEVLAGADLFVFPSRFEGFPGAVLEAMALGLPIVASDIAPHREMVETGRSALLVAPDGSEELAAGIAFCLDNRSEAASYGARARERFVSHFDLATAVSGMVALYRGLAS